MSQKTRIYTPPKWTPIVDGLPILLNDINKNMPLATLWEPL